MKKHLHKLCHLIVSISFFPSSFSVFPFHYFPISIFSHFFLFPFHFFHIYIFSDFDELLYEILNTYWIFPSSISSKSWSIMEVLLDVDPVLLSSECLEPSMIFLLFSSNFEPLSLNFQSRMKIVSKGLGLSNKYMWLNVIKKIWSTGYAAITIHVFSKNSYHATYMSEFYYLTSFIRGGQLLFRQNSWRTP